MQEKEKKELIILIIGIVGLAFSWKFTHMTPKQAVSMKGFIKERAAPFIPSGEGLFKQGPFQPKRRGEVKYAGRENRDPLDNAAILEGLGEAKEAAPRGAFPTQNFSVSAVIWDSTRPQAIVNDKIVTVGEMLGGSKITKIDKRGVHIDFEGEEELLAIK